MQRSEDYSFFEDKEFKEALSEYETMLREGRKAYMDAADLTDIAEYYMVKGRHDEAMRCIDYALTLHPDDMEPLIFLAREKMYDGDLETAIAMCDRIPDQRDREVDYLRAEILLRQGKPEECFELLLTLYRQTNEDPELFLHDCIDLVADYLYYDKALEWTELLQREHPDYEKIPMLMCEMLIQNGKYEEAIKQLETEIDKDAYNTAFWRMLAEAHNSLGQYEEAEEAIEYSLAINETDADALGTKGSILLNQNRLEEALQCFQEHLRQRPENDYIIYLQSTCLAAMERYDEALDVLEKAMPPRHIATSNTPTVLLQRAFLLSRLGHFGEAIKQLEKYREMIAAAEMPDYHIHRGYILLEHERLNEAREEFMKAFACSENKEDTLKRIALTLFDWQYYSFALPLFRELTDHGNSAHRPEYLPYLAFCYFSMNQTAKYQETLPEAIRQNRSLTAHLFSSIFPNIPPEEYLSQPDPYDCY